jgi:hypothetical protein
MSSNQDRLLQFSFDRYSKWLMPSFRCVNMSFQYYWGDISRICYSPVLGEKYILTNRIIAQEA